MNSSSGSYPVKIDLDIGDRLTSISCGHIVVELVKFIAYQRQQIPYTYPWLKQVVNKKKFKDVDESGVTESYQAERHFHIVSTALENLDFILKSILQEINGSTLPSEVCIALGATPFTLREVYRMLLPEACHKQQCHSDKIATDQVIQRMFFRSFITSEKLSKVFFNQLSPTNMYVFLKKRSAGSQESVTNSDNFYQMNGCRIPQNSKVVVIDFRTPNSDGVTCCNEIAIFGDDSVPIENTDENKEIDFFEIESTANAVWYQSSYIMKGFKDCLVKGSSITNLWLKS